MNPKSSDQIPEIFGEVLSKAREDKGLSRSDLAGALCLATKHIEQIEEGGEKSFFSKQHKVQVAKKVADYLEVPYEKILSVYNAIDSSEQSKDISTNKAPLVKDVEMDLPNFPEKKSQEPLFAGQQSKKKWFVLGGSLLVLVGLLSYWKFVPSNSQIYQTSSVQETKTDSIEVSKKNESKVELEAKVDPKEVPENKPEDPCNLPTQSVPQFVAPKANFAGNFVYLVSRADQNICVIDGKGKKQNVSLTLGENKSFFGVAPFTILAKDFSKVNVYFQGWRAVPSSATTTTLQVQEAPIFVKPENAEDITNIKTDSK